LGTERRLKEKQLHKKFPLTFNSAADIKPENIITGGDFMVKRYSVSVSDALGAMIDKWKDEISPSTLFQQAMTAEIAKREGFNQRIREDTDMEGIIERLRKEKKEKENEYFGMGKEDGLEWAKAADYEDLISVTGRDFDDAFLPLFKKHWRRDNPQDMDHIINYIEEILYENLDLPADNSGEKLDPRAFKWLSGWYDGVWAFWDEVSDKL
jgi:hypothetical protein